MHHKISTRLLLVSSAVTACLGLAACAKKKEESTSATNNYSILNVTGPVGGAGSSAASTGSPGALATGVLFSSGSVAGGARAYYSFQEGQNFFRMGKQGDSMACVVRALANNNVIGTTGAPSYFDMEGQSRMRMTATSEGGAIVSYTIHSCANTNGTYAQDAYIGSSVTGGTGSLVFKLQQTGVAIAMTISGTVQNGIWESKSIAQDLIFSSMLMRSRITQGASTLSSQSAFKLDASTTMQMNSLSTLYGDSEATYALGDGSVRLSLNSGADQTGHWDSSGVDAGTSSHAASLSSAAYLAIPTSGEMTTSTGFGTGETWDCALGDNLANLNSLSESARGAITACMGSQP